MESRSELQSVDNVHAESSTRKRAPRNRTLTLSADDRRRLAGRVLGVENHDAHVPLPLGRTVCGDSFQCLPMAPKGVVDLVVLDPPYNLNKTFNGRAFSRRAVHDYTEWLDNVCSLIRPLLKETASIYICGDWFSSPSIFTAASKHFEVRNRITWEREKGRGAKANWKNSSEDIWFCTVSNQFTFNLDAVKLRRRVLAPYTKVDGAPKDWMRTDGGNFRDTCPSNFWSDITVPFWSMPENTEHPTQKSEKLIAKLILASSNPGDVVLDPFLGSGTSSVAAKKLRRRFLGIELDQEYCLFAEKRLELAEDDTRIQGFDDGVFWERNSQPVIRTQSGKVLTLDLA